MGSLKVTLCAGAALAAILTPTAHAADGGGVSATPSRPAPGTGITLRAAGCAGKTAVARSAVFVSDVRLALASTDGTLVGSGRVRSTAAAGAHEVTVRCGAVERTGTLTVAGRTPPDARPAAPASPVAPVDAGGGGAARLTAAGDHGRTAGPGAADTVTGLLLAGAAAVAVALGGVRRRGGAD